MKPDPAPLRAVSGFLTFNKKKKSCRKTNY
jgi:hypothetical protein